MSGFAPNPDALKRMTNCPRCDRERVTVMVCSGITYTCGTWVRGGSVQTIGEACIEKEQAA